MSAAAVVGVWLAPGGSAAQVPTRPPTPRDTVRADSTRRDTTRADSLRTDSLAAPTNRAAPAQPRPPRRARGVGAPVIKPPLSPRRAMLYSMALPGYGQTRLGRSGTGAFFFFVETGALTMIAKSSFDLRAARAFRSDSVLPTSYPVDTATGLPATSTSTTVATERNNFADALVRARRLHLEDWLAVVAFNHLIAGAEAYVSANLWDLPTQISASPTTQGGVRVAMSVAW